ncbi:MAG TPA: competence/damage-inducible protein A [Bacteroidia bacterium]|jgi:nicotinamide-nucleotide amidase|nr:competence/damage-inducible protein A [Bacteroidia bacterium]
MLAEIITIGDEILIGQIVDTNSAWMGVCLNENGIKVHQITSVSDNKQHIIEALNAAIKRVDIILITGGLGPTRDDITKQTLSEYFNAKLVFNAEAFKDVEHVFKIRGREVTEINRKQAELPENCTALSNKNGTAPGMWFEEKGKVFVSMPGVPYEMKALMTNEVIPRLKKKFELPVIMHKTVLTQGIGESMLAEMIEAWEDSLAKENISLAYLPSIGSVRLRLSTRGKDEAALKQTIDRKVKELQALAGNYIYGYDNETLEGILGSILLQKKKTVSTAESCTGGYMAHMITSISGSSEYFKGSVISYADEVKINVLGVKAETIEKHGAVSQETVEQMAANVRKKLNTDYSIAVSGIAGPSGGTPEKPVGTVWIAIATPDKVISKKFLFGDNRGRNIHLSAITGLNMLRKELLATS